MTDESTFDGFASPSAETLVSFQMIGKEMYATITSRSITSVELPAIRKALFDAIGDADGTRSLIVDMAQVEFMNSQALGMLIEVHSAAGPQGIRMVLAGVRPGVREMLEVTKLTGVFPVCSTHAELEAALAGRDGS